MAAANKATERQSVKGAAFVYGFMGVLAFSLTLPATRVAVAYLDPLFIGFGRVEIAAVLAAVLLVTTRQQMPSRLQWGRLVIVSSGVVLGFPLLSSWAMAKLPAAHGAIVLGILPLATALVSALRNGERPTWGFWLASAAGSVVVVGFAVLQGAGSLQLEDVALLAAVIAAAFGYAEGGRLAVEMGGWQVICWALVLLAPFLALPMLLVVMVHNPVASFSAWLGFGYVSVVSQLLGFFAWYRGLALGGVARISQIQLLQPFLTILAAALLLGEPLMPLSILAALLVLAIIALGRMAGIARRYSAPIDETGRT